MQTLITFQIGNCNIAAVHNDVGDDLLESLDFIGIHDRRVFADIRIPVTTDLGFSGVGNRHDDLGEASGVGDRRVVNLRYVVEQVKHARIAHAKEWNAGLSGQLHKFNCEQKDDHTRKLVDSQKIDD